jgi:hypothetical protein
MTLNDLICKIECEELIFKLARHLDNHEFEENKRCYTADAVVTSNTGAPPVRVQDMSVEMMKGQSSGYKPRLVTSITVTPDGPSRAKVFCYCTIAREWLPSTEWHFDLVKTDAGWLCSSQKVAIIERYPGELKDVAARRAEAAKTHKS